MSCHKRTKISESESCIVRHGAVGARVWEV